MEVEVLPKGFWTWVCKLLRINLSSSPGDCCEMFNFSAALFTFVRFARFQLDADDDITLNNLSESERPQTRSSIWQQWFMCHSPPPPPILIPKLPFHFYRSPDFSSLLDFHGEGNEELSLGNSRLLLVGAFVLVHGGGKTRKIYRVANVVQ